MTEFRLRAEIRSGGKSALVRLGQPGQWAESRPKASGRKFERRRRFGLPINLIFTTKMVKRGQKFLPGGIYKTSK